MAEPFTAIVLAGQRAGVVNEIAAAHGVSHKCLAPIAGKPLIVHVLDALMAMPGLVLVRVSVEPDAVAELRALTETYSVPIEFVESAPSLADSVIAAAQEASGPFIITTADNVLLTQASVDALRAAFADGAQAAAALTTRAAVLAAHPEGQRRFYELRDDAYSNCNLYGIADRQALKAAEIFREGGQFVKNPKRMIAAFGLINVLLMRYRLVGIHSLTKRISKRLGLDLRAVILTDGSAAIDVDNARTYVIAEGLLAKRS